MKERYSIETDDNGYQVVKESTEYDRIFRTVPMTEIVNMLNGHFEASCVADDGREINLSNYNSDDVEHLNEGMSEIHQILFRSHA